MRERLSVLKHRLVKDYFNLLNYSTLLLGVIIITYFYYTNVIICEVPIGWDTASYLAEGKVFKLYGLSRFLGDYNGQSFLFALILGILDILGIDVILVVKVMPYVAIIAIVILLNKIAKMDSELSGLLIIPFTLHWFTIIRFSSDLLRSLLSLVGFMFVWSYFPAFIKCNLRLRPLLPYIATILLVSFIQIEFSLLIVAVIDLAILLEIIFTFHQNKGIINLTALLKKLIIVSSLVIPAFLLAISYSTYFMALSYPVPLPSLLSSPTRLQEVLNNFYLSLLPLTILGFIVSVKNAKHVHLFMISLTMIVISGFLFACLPFYTPFRVFVTRLSYLFPMPFLVSVGLGYVLKSLDKFYIIIASESKIRIRIQIRSSILILILVLLVFVVPLQHTMNTIKIYWRPFISSTAFNNLKVIASNTSLASIPIFIIYTEDGSTAYMYNNWITALVGQHYTYLGSLNNFLALIPTNFSDTYATKWSQVFLEELIQAGVTSHSAFCEHPIFLVTDMYNKPLTKEEIQALIPLSFGLYSLNCSSIASWNYTGTQRPVERNFIIPLKKGYVTISIEIEGGGSLYLNLDYLRFVLIDDDFSNDFVKYLKKL